VSSHHDRDLIVTVPKPTWHLKKAHNFDPGLKIRRGDGLEEIPF
jgi:hypothetical protein